MGQRGSSSCIVRRKKRVTSCAYFCTFFFVRVFRFVLFVCLFFPPFCLLCLDFVLPVYIEYTSAAAAFSFFPPVFSGHCDGMYVCLPVSISLCVCVGVLFKFFFYALRRRSFKLLALS